MNARRLRRERRQRLVSQRHQSQARTVRALRRPASQLSPGVAETSHEAGRVSKAAAPNCSNLQAEQGLAIRRLPKSASPARRRRGERLDIASATSFRFLRRGSTPEGCQSTYTGCPADSMSMMFPINCCVMGGDDVDDEHQQPVWPPTSPPLTTTHGRLTLVRGYLKRKSTRNLEDGGPPRWALRWLEVDPPEEDRPEYMLSVYKTSARSKRLNAVSLKKISSVRHDDSLPCAFVVSVGESNYTLLARDAADCDTWVQSLNDAREALSVEPGAQCVAS